MNKPIIALLAATALCAAAAPVLAQSADAADVDQRLADAQRRLEDAAREVAELSGEATGAHRGFNMFIPGPRRAMLGVNLGGAEPNGGGVRVEGVSPGGPAAEAGVKPGDIIIAMESKPVTTGRELVKAMEAIKPGDQVALELRRDGKPVKLTVEARPLDRLVLAGPGAMMPLPAIAALPALPALAAPGDHGLFRDSHWLLDGWGDAELVTLTAGLGRYFGADKGVLVARAPQDKALGLQDGDVIVAIGGREPQSGRHAMRILRSYQPGESIELRILRDRRAQTLSVKVPERADDAGGRRRVLPDEPAESASS